MKAIEIKTNEYAPYYGTYISKAPDMDIIEGLRQNGKLIKEALESLPEDKWDHSYAPGKWTIKELVHHIIDTERIFSYRALRFGRGDTTDLPGFDQDDFVSGANSNSRTSVSLIAEYKAVRESTICLFESFSQDDLLRIGIASGSPMSVRALGFVIVGHETHHLNILNERYL